MWNVLKLGSVIVAIALVVASGGGAAMLPPGFAQVGDQVAAQIRSGDCPLIGGWSYCCCSCEFYNWPVAGPIETTGNDDFLGYCDLVNQSGCQVIYIKGCDTINGPS